VVILQVYKIRNVSTDPLATGRGSLEIRRAHLGTADLSRAKALPSSDEVKNEWICDPNIHCIIPLSRKPESDASLHMKLVELLAWRTDKSGSGYTRSTTRLHPTQGRQLDFWYNLPRSSFTVHAQWYLAVALKATALTGLQARQLRLKV